MLITVLIVFTLSVSRSYGQLQTNVTTTCSNGNCTTTICVNNESCKSTNSNSANITTFGDLLKNKTIPMPPEEVV
jgi:hypothetical protein